MDSKIVIFAFLIGCSYAAYTQESAASPAQIAYAISQNYDDTGPGANGLLQQSSSPSPQSHSSSTTQQYSSSPAYTQHQYQQPQVYTQQQYAQPQQYTQQHYSHPVQYSHQQIAYTQPQALSHPQQSHSNFGRYQTSQASHPQVSYSSVQTAPHVYHHQAAQPSHVAYQAQPAYSHHQVYSQQPQIAYPVVKAAKPQAQHAPQAEAYDTNVQYSYTYEQDGQQGDSKNPHETRQGEAGQGSYSFVIPEGHYAQEPQNSLIVQRPSPKGHGHESQSYVSQVAKYNPPTKQIYSSTVAKPVFAAPSVKYSSPIHHQYTYNH